MKVILRSTLHLILCLVLCVSAHAQLQSLTTSGGLKPVFSNNVYNYSRPIGPATTSLVLNFTLVAGSTIKINGVDVAASPYTLVVSKSVTECTLEVTAANGAKSVYTIQLPMLSVSLTITKANCGKEDGAASVVFNNATEPYTIQWWNTNYINQGTGTSVTGLAPGAYWCNAILSDGSGYFVSTYFTVGVNNPLAINGVKTDVTCFGARNGQIALSPSGGTAPYTYAWSNLATGATVGNLTPRNYSVTVNDAGGCSQTGSFTITQPAALSAASTSTGVTCNGAKDGKASVSPSGGTAPYTYTWTNVNSTSSSVSGLGAGAYSCTIKDKNGCTFTKDFTITEPGAITASAIQTDVSCRGLLNGSIALTPAGGTPDATGYTYIWSPSGGTLATAKNLAAGNYSCEIKDSRGCKINKSYTVAQPLAALAATITAKKVSCNGGSDGAATVEASGGTAPYTYTWSASAVTDTTVTGLKAGTYSCTIKDANKCTLVKDITIVQPEAALAMNVLQTQKACEAEKRNKASVTVSGGTAPYLYAWSPLGGNDAVTTELYPGNYTITITDGNGCKANKTIALTAYPAVVVKPITGNATLLVNGSTTLSNGVSGGIWSSSNTTVATVDSISGLVTGVSQGITFIRYTVSNGVCERSVSQSIRVNPLPPQAFIVSGPAPFTNERNASFTFGSNVGGVTYQASFGGNAFTMVFNPFITVGLKAGNYTLSVRAIDNYGTIGEAQGVYKWTVDLAPPTGAVVINANAVYTNKTTVALAITADDDNGDVEAAFSNDGITYSEYATVTPEKNWELTSGDGNKTVYMQLRDKAGNTTVVNASVWLDTTAPPVPVITQPANNSSTNNALPVVKGTAEADAAVSVYIDGAFATTVHSNAEGNWQYLAVQPLNNGAHEIKVKATDKAGNESAFTNISSFSIDTTALTAQLSSQALQYINSAFKVSVVFNKPVTDFDKRDIVVVNGSVSDLTTIDNSAYNATITPSADGEVIVSVAENAVRDAAGNGNIASDTLVRKYDAARPVVSMATTAANPLNKAFGITITFSEAVTGFDKSGLAVNNGTVSGFASINATTYTATITPVADGKVIVGVAENVASDAAGNGNIASDTLVREYDATKPVVTISTAAANSLNKAFDITLMLSEAVTGFGRSGLTVENGVISSFTSIDATTYTATITPAVDGEVKVSVAENSASDAAGNGNVASDRLVRKYDATKPVATITTTAANPLNKAFDITVTFSEAVTGFDKSGLAVNNGAVSGFASISATVYAATITPAIDGEVVVSVAENSASDAAGNSNIASDTLVRRYDATRPMVSIATTAANPLNEAFDIIVTFSEPVTGFGKSGLTVENSTVSGFASISATTYAATITPVADGEVIVGVVENAASDAAGNGNIASDTLARKYDAIRPIASVVTTAANPLNKAFDITVTFGEAVTGFNKSGLTVNNGSVSSFTIIDSTAYTATITPAADGDVIVGVAEKSASDVAGNDNIASDTLVRKYDATKPVVTIASAAANPVNKAFDITVTFSEPVKGFGKSGLAVENGTVSDFASISATTYAATITPVADGEVIVGVAENTVRDAAGNGNVASDTLMRKYDATKPMVSIATTAANPLNKAFDITVTFSEAVTGFGKSGLIVKNGAVSDFASISTTAYVATITPAIDDEVTVSVAENVASDEAGNGNISSDTLVSKYDATRPMVSIATTAANPLNKAFDITVTFSEAVTDFGKSGLIVDNGAVSGFTVVSSTTYTATITAAADGEVIVGVAENAALDAAGNGNTASDTLVRKYDATKPVVTIATTAANPLNKAFGVTVTFSEVVSGFGKSGLIVDNGAVSGFTVVSAAAYAATITPAADGEVIVSVVENAASDAAGNRNIASDTLVRKYDATRPMVSIATNAANPLNKSFDITVTFSEVVTGFGESGLTVKNAIVSDFASISATAYAATITPSVDGEVIVGVAENAALDPAGNGNIASDTLVRKYDATRPMASIASTAANPLNKAFDITVTFSEPVTGFGKSGLTVKNGIVSDFAIISATAYVATITPAVDGEVVVGVAENAATDAAGNGSVASDTLVRKYDATRPAAIVTATASDLINKPFDITVTFSEAVTGFGKSNLTVNNGAVSGFTSVDAKTYTAIITPATDGEVNVNVAENAARDAAGNGSIASDTLLRKYDATQPTVIVTTSAVNPLNGAFEVIIRFSETVTGFNKAGLVVTNGAVSGFTRVDATTYNATIVPDTDGEVKVSVAGSVAQDAAGNGNVVSDALVRNYVAGKPIVTLSSASSGLLNNAFEITVVFSRAVKDFDKAGLKVINGTVLGFISLDATIYTATIAPVADGEVKVSVAGNVTQDTAGNGNLASDILVRTYDGTRPGVTILTAVNSPVNTSPLHFEINFTEEVSGFVANNILVTNGFVSKLEGAGSKYNVEITPSAIGPVTVSVQENEVADVAGNKNTGSNITAVVFDSLKVITTIVAPAGVTAPYTATIYFSKRVSGFSVNKISVSNATLSLFTKINDSVYSVLVTPMHEGQVEISVAAGVVLDAAGNINAPSAIVTTMARFDAVIDQVYPVPANTVLNVRFKGITKQKMRVLLTDMRGNVVRDREVAVQANMMTLHVADLPSGIYYMVIPSVGHTLNWKILIAR